MANFDEFYEQAISWAKKNTLFFEVLELNEEDGNEAFLEGYYNLPENFFDKDDNFDKLYEPLKKLYVLEQYINKSTIIL
tara:strand:- start:4877 stop:5113 length:237 start_codon:yes stop_codon:yes gene_type:complete